MATKKRTSRRRTSRKAAARRSSRRRAPRRRVSRRRTSRRRVSRNRTSARRTSKRRTSARRTSRAKRFVLRVKPYHRKETNGWAVVKSGRKTPLSFHRMKSAAMKKARRLAKAQWRKGRKSQVVFYKRDGRIQGERTYGLDPRRTKG